MEIPISIAEGRERRRHLCHESLRTGEAVLAVAQTLLHFGHMTRHTTLFVTSQRFLQVTSYGRHTEMIEISFTAIKWAELTTTTVLNEWSLSEDTHPLLRMHLRNGNEDEWVIYNVPADAESFYASLSRVGRVGNVDPDP